MEWRKSIRSPREDDTLAFGIPLSEALLSEALLEAPTPRQPQVEACVAAKAANADGADDSGKPFLTSLQVCDILVVQG